jgi:3-hydroxyisobutyrate dehydrogenase
LTIERVGYLGIGTIGEPIAANVLAAGFDLMVFDLRSEPLARMQSAGAKRAASLAELGAHAQLLEVSIAGDDRIEAALLGSEGALHSMTPDAIIALHSTMAPATVRRIAAAATRARVHVIDAQVSGGKAGAVARRLCYMVGGDPAIFERCRRVFETSGSNLFHMGPIGAGASAKLAQQMMTCMHIAATAEGTRIAAAAGVDLERFFTLLHVSAGQSYVADNWEHLSNCDRELTEGFYIGLKPALEMGYDLGVPVPGTALAQQSLRTAIGPDRVR